MTPCHKINILHHAHDIRVYRAKKPNVDLSLVFVFCVVPPHTARAVPEFAGGFKYDVSAAGEVNAVRRRLRRIRERGTPVYLSKTNRTPVTLGSTRPEHCSSDAAGIGVDKVGLGDSTPLLPSPTSEIQSEFLNTT